MGYDPTQKLPLLTSREKEVLLLIAEGMTNPQIAQQLFISLHTVDSHRKNLLTKFEVNNTAGLIKLAAKYNMI
jgi:DNA-binding CsgD family transcriptional regulator